MEDLMEGSMESSMESSMACRSASCRGPSDIRVSRSLEHEMGLCDRTVDGTLDRTR